MLLVQPVAVPVAEGPSGVGCITIESPRSSQMGWSSVVGIVVAGSESFAAASDSFAVAPEPGSFAGFAGFAMDLLAEESRPGYMAVTAVVTTG